MSLTNILESIKEVYVTEVLICQNIMGMIYSVGKDTCRIVDEIKEILTLTFKITISIVTIIQDIEDVILELKDLSDMLHFSINSVDRSKVNDRLDHLKVIIAELRSKASQKHVVLDFLSMIVEDGLKMRYGEKKSNATATQDISAAGAAVTSSTANTTETDCGPQKAGETMTGVTTDTDIYSEIETSTNTLNATTSHERISSSAV